MVPTAQESRQQAVCTHGVRGLDPALGVCIPCRDAVLYCRGCARVIDATSWLRYGRQCEDCFDDEQLRNKIAEDFRWFVGQQQARAAVGAELRAQDRGGA